jgi:transposase
MGTRRLETWLRNRKVLRADRLAETAVQAAERQHTSLPGEKLTARLVHTLAEEVMALNQQVAELDKAIEARFRDHHTFDVITSMPGLGIILGAEFLAATGGDMTVFGTPDRLAGFGGVAPVPRTSARRPDGVRLRTKVTKRAGSRAAGLAMVFKLVESAQVRWRAVNAPNSSPSCAPEPASNAATSSNAPNPSRPEPLVSCASEQ